MPENCSITLRIRSPRSNTDYIDVQVTLDTLTVIVDSGAAIPPINVQHVIPLVANLEDSIAARQCYLTFRNLRELLLGKLEDFDGVFRNHFLQLEVVRSVATLRTGEYRRSFMEMR